MAQSTYTQYYSNFVGADMSSDARVVARNRLAYSVNMWRDYESNQGAAIETMPGFRKIIGLPTGDLEINRDPIYGMWHYKGAVENYIIVHYEKYLLCFQKSEILKLNTHLQLSMDEIEKKAIDSTMNYGASTSFTNNNNFYIVNHGRLVKVFEEYEAESDKYAVKSENVTEFYVPTTYYNGKPYEQRNGFNDRAIQIDTTGGVEDETEIETDGAPLPVKIRTFTIYEKAYKPNVKVFVDDDEFSLAAANQIGEKQYFITSTGSGANILKSISIREADVRIGNSDEYKNVRIEFTVDETHFNTVGALVPFSKSKTTMKNAILNCTKSAVYDGRVFLTGNPDLPNTVFYSQRNLTGANDPMYFGVYNYFNDGDGNTPNVDLLSTPSMLMVIKGDTTQDGSVYYHVGADNPHSEKSVRDLVPRVYPSTQGAAGLGSAGTTETYSLSCNFLDDPVFLSRRGLEGVSKEQLNAERTIGHRSSNIDKLLVKEDLAHASIAEWKGYLVICCNGHIYLADSRAVSQHQDGSYQYEWFYLQDVATYQNYDDVYETATRWQSVNGILLKDYVTMYEGDKLVSDEYKISTDAVKIPHSKVGVATVYPEGSGFLGDAVLVRYYTDDQGDKYIVELIPGEKMGVGNSYSAKRVLAVGDLLFFATDYDICVFNTDMRGKPIKDESGEIIREVDDDKIDSSWYTFNGVPYKSACALRLDDCDKKSLTKTTIYGTTVARLKMMPGSKCKIKSSINGRDWQDLAEVYSTRQDFSDLRFDNMSFAENEDNVAVLPEVSRGWIQKQYYFESDGFCEPFGLYELSYIYKIAGKIRYV